MLAIREAGGNEQPIGKTVEKANEFWTGRIQRDYASFGTTAYGAGMVQSGSMGGASRQDKVAKGLELPGHFIDRSLQPSDLPFPDGLVDKLAVRWGRKLGAEIEKPVLDTLEIVILCRVNTGNPDDRVQFIHIADRGHQGIRFGNASAPDQTRRALIPGLSVNLHFLVRSTANINLGNFAVFLYFDGFRRRRHSHSSRAFWMKTGARLAFPA